MITKQQISEVKEYLRHAILQEAIEQIEDDDYDQIELNEVFWRLFGADNKPIDPESNKPKNKVLDGSGEIAQDKGGIILPDGTLARRVADNAVTASAEEQGVRRKQRKAITQDQLPGVLKGINDSMRSLVRGGKLVDGWENMEATSELAGYISHFTTSTHTELRENGINPEAIIYALDKKHDEGGHLTKILDFLADRDGKDTKTVGRDIRHFNRTRDGTPDKPDKPGQLGIPHPHRVSGLHKYKVRKPENLTDAHKENHADLRTKFLDKHGDHVRYYSSLMGE